MKTGFMILVALPLVAMTCALLFAYFVHVRRRSALVRLLRLHPIVDTTPPTLTELHDYGAP